MCFRGAFGRDCPRVLGAWVRGSGRTLGVCRGLWPEGRRPLTSCSCLFLRLPCHEPGSRVSSGNSRTHSNSSIHPLPRRGARGQGEREALGVGVGWNPIPGITPFPCVCLTSTECREVQWRQSLSRTNPKHRFCKRSHRFFSQFHPRG